MIQNRAFQGSPVFPPNLTSWGGIGGASLELVADAQPLSDALPNSVLVQPAGSANGGHWSPWGSSGGSNTIGIYNTGWWGFSVKPQTYTGSFYVKGDYSGQFVASFVSNATGQSLASVSIVSESVSNSWTQHNFTLVPTAAAPDSNNTFSITFEADKVSGSGLNFNLISVFPPTYKSRVNGLRPDLMSALHGLNPSFLRFAGGNNLEGSKAPYYWKWNETIGPLTARPGRPGTWSYENTDGLGLIDYLDWCTDLAIEPILAVWAGLYLDGTIIPQDELQPYVDEALALLEFIMGSADTPNGALRASLGYGTAPLAQINYVEVGNEDYLNNGTDSYYEYRFPMFYKAIRAAYPDIHIISSTVTLPLPDDDLVLGDYHTYGRPNNMVLQFNDFDQNTSAHKVFLGEYASIQDNVGPNNDSAPVDWSGTGNRWPIARWIGTVAEAVYLIGAERNSDAILGAGYAPTLQNVNSYQWAPDLIMFSADPDQTTLSTSYYMIQLLSQNRFTETLPVTTSEGDFGPAYWVAGAGGDGRQMIKFAVYNSSVPVDFNVAFSGTATTGQLTLLTGPEDAYQGNEFGSGQNVVKTTVSEIQAGSDGTFSLQLPELSVGIFAV